MNAETTPITQYVTIGRFGKTHGLKGFLRVHSDTESFDKILDYRPWFIKNKEGLQSLDLINHKQKSHDLLVHIKGFDSPESAQTLVGCDILVDREILPKLSEQAYYWADLENLQVLDTSGKVLGTVSHLIEAGACDVMVLKGKQKHMIPFDYGNVVKRVDIESGVIEVDWDLDY